MAPMGSMVPIETGMCLQARVDLVHQGSSPGPAADAGIPKEGLGFRASLNRDSLSPTEPVPVHVMLGR